MTTQIEKAAHGLAERAVERKYMRKQAQPPTQPIQLPRAVQTALIGSLLGGSGVGLISALSGRRRGALAKDLLLGALVGGAGGAAYPYVTETAGELAGKISGPELTPEQRSEARQKAVAGTIRGTGGPGVQAGLTGVRDIVLGAGRGLYGEGSGADVLSKVAPLGIGAGVTGVSHAREMAQSGKLFKQLPTGLPRWKRWTTRGLRATPGIKSLKYGALTALALAALERAFRMPTSQGAAQ